MSVLESVPDYIAYHAQAQPHQTALIIAGLPYDYATFWDAITHQTNAFRAAGLPSGALVTLTAAPELDFVVAFFALQCVGAVAIPLSPNLPRARRQNIEKQLRPDFYRYSTKGLERVGQGGASPVSDCTHIMFTSGTTGEPKGVMLSNPAIMSAVHNINAYIGNNAQDTELVTVPLAHSFGLGRLRCILVAGGTAILSQGLAQLGKVVRDLKTHAVTGLSAVPLGLSLLLRLTKGDIASLLGGLKYVEIGSAPMAKSDRIQLVKQLPHTKLCAHYGLTEASRSTFVQLTSSDAQSVGYPLSGVALDVRHNNDTHVGQIWIKGPHVMQGYWRAPERTRDVLQAGWLNTGDVGYLDATGALHLIGRQGDMMNIGGYTVSPVEIEQALKTHPAILDCACVQDTSNPDIPSDSIIAHVVCAPDAEKPDRNTLQDHLKDKLEDYKWPRHYQWHDKLAYTASGKLQRTHYRTKEEKAHA